MIKERKFRPVSRNQLRAFDVHAIARSIIKQGMCDAAMEMNALKVEQANLVKENVKKDIKEAVYKTYQEMNIEGN